MPPAYEDAAYSDSACLPPAPPVAAAEAPSTGKRSLLDESASVFSESISVIIPPTRLSRNIGSYGEVLSDAENSQSSQPAVRASAASAFEMRMRRDQRFQKPAVPEVIKETRSPVRSPLAPAHANSPKACVPVFHEAIKAVDLKSKNAIADAKRALSPTRSHAAMDAKENVTSHMPAKSPARLLKRPREEPIVKMTAKQTARAADQRAKQRAIDLLGTAIAPPINPARRLRSRAV